jgi:hypothetical protein
MPLQDIACSMIVEALEDENAKLRKPLAESDVRGLFGREPPSDPRITSDITQGCTDATVLSGADA